jgi:hypothetical protein
MIESCEFNTVSSGPCVQRSRLAAVPVFEKLSARQPKPIRIVMIKFSTKFRYKTVKPKLKTIDS